MSLNIFTVGGNLAADAVLGSTKGGTPALNFRLPATVYDFKKKEDQTFWVDCVVLGDRAPKLVDHLKKGKGITVLGELTIEQVKRDDKEYLNVRCLVSQVDFAVVSENRLVISGQIGADSELRNAGETKVLNARMAFRSGYGDHEKTSWIALGSLFGKRAEALAAKLAKGTGIAVAGSFAVDVYKDAAGVEKRRPSILVDKLTIQPKKEKSNASTKEPANSDDGASSPGIDLKDDDCPF